MNKVLKILLIVAASLILLGGGIFVITMMNLHWDFTQLSTVKYETNTYEISEEIRHISISTSTANIKVLPSEDGICKITCVEAKKEKHTVSVENGVLTITETDTRKWYDYINFFSFGRRKITVWLPDGAYGEFVSKQSTGNFELTKNFDFAQMDVFTSTGDILMSDVSADEMRLSVTTGNVIIRSVTCQGDLNVSVSTGKANLVDVTCRNLHSNGNTGNIDLKNVIVLGALFIERSTGDVVLSGCDAAEICITTDTGNVTGTVLSDKVFITRTDTGRIQVPESTLGGKCKVTTDTGDIKIQIAN